MSKKDASRDGEPPDSAQPETIRQQTPAPSAAGPDAAGPDAAGPGPSDPGGARPVAGQAGAGAAEVENLRGQVAELEDRWKRELAETENLRKRLAKDLATAQEAERRRVTAAWLPIVDNLELALAHADEADPIVAGVKAVRDQALDLLAALGYPRDDEIGVGFDPVRHEAVSVASGGGEPGTVVSVVRPGYGKAQQQLRPAAVVVAGDRQDS